MEDGTVAGPSGSDSATLDKDGRQVSMTDPIHPGLPFTTTFRADGRVLSQAAANGNSTA